jgi:hypothetical protein
MIDIDIVWNRIKQHEGEVFHLLQGDELCYSIQGERLTHNRTQWPLYKRSFEEAIRQVPLSNPEAVGKTIRGGSYIFAILMDERVRGADW